MPLLSSIDRKICREQIFVNPEGVRRKDAPSNNPTRSRFPSLRTPKSDRLPDHTKSVITYLVRYTHRIALSNARILGLDGDSVHLRYRDGEHNTLVLEAPELVRRFLQRLAQIREILSAPPPEPDPKSGEHEPGWPCPVCRQGRMRPVCEIELRCAPYR